MPAAGSWSTIPASHPAGIEQSLTLGLLRTSATGRHVYTVGVWLDGGRANRRILRSDDIGTSWCRVETPDPVVDVMPAPTKEAVVYAVTTRGVSGQRALLRTADGGRSWTTARAAVPEEAPIVGQQPIEVEADPNVLWFKGRASWYWTGDGGDTWKAVALPSPTPPIVDPAMPNRLFLRDDDSSSAQVSTDWGATWATSALPALDPCTGGWPYGCGISVDSSSILYGADAITTSIGNVTSIRVWTSSTWGASWVSFPDAPSPYYSVPTTLGSHVRGALFVWTQMGLLGSEDSGRHWSPVNADKLVNVVALTPRSLIRDAPAGPEATSNGGETWRALPAVRAPTSLIAAPVAPYPVWADGALMRSDDGGLTWSPPRSSNATAAFADGADAEVAYATTASEVMRTENAGATWEAVTSPTGHAFAAIAVCPPPRSCLFVVDSTSANALMFRSDDHGRTWAAPTPWTNWDTRSAVVVSPDNPDHLLQGRSDAVYETRDGGQTWNYDKLDLAVVGIAFRSNDSVVAVTDERAVIESADGGVTWTPAASQPPTGRARRLIQSTRRPATLFIVTGDAQEPLFRSDDAGATWTGLPALGDGETGDGYANPIVNDVVDLGDRFLASVSGYGLVWFQ
jgi:photosystem II stability/assembly factor-like uncharacterized protein